MTPSQAKRARLDQAQAIKEANATLPTGYTISRDGADDKPWLVRFKDFTSDLVSCHSSLEDAVCHARYDAEKFGIK